MSLPVFLVVGLFRAAVVSCFHRNFEEADWLWNQSKDQLKHFLLDPGKMDVWDFRMCLWNVPDHLRALRALDSLKELNRTLVCRFSIQLCFLNATA